MTKETILGDKRARPKHLKEYYGPCYQLQELMKKTKNRTK